MWLQSVKAQKGSVTLMALLAMLILGTSAGLYMMAAGSGIGNRQNYGDSISAQYAAEAGVMYVLAHAKENTSAATGKWDNSTLSTATNSLDSTKKNSPTFIVKVTLLTTTLKEPDGTVFNGKYYRITSVGKAGNTTRNIDAYLTIPATDPPSPITTFDLMKDADYSGNKWSMNNTDPHKPFASAPDDEYYQVLFKDTVYANDENHKDKTGNKGFTLNYNVNLVKTTPGHSNDTGYGIYYLATGNADNMTAYVLQYDPGLNNQILVKKVIASKTTPKHASDNEVDGSNTGAFQYSMAHPTWDWNSPTLNNVDPLARGASQDLMAIPIDKVLDKLNRLGVNDGKNTMTGQNHQLTIDARPAANGRVVHTISMDGLEILKFIDRGLSPGGKPLTVGSTGLRVWEATAQFFNNTNGETSGAVGSIKIRSWGVEKNN